MKTSIKGLFVIMAVVMSFVVIQSVCAETCTYTVEGEITAISTRPNVVTVYDGNGDLIDVYSVPFNSLSKHSGIDLSPEEDVSFEVYDYVCKSGETVVRACEITADGETVGLRDCPPLCE